MPDMEPNASPLIEIAIPSLALACTAALVAGYAWSRRRQTSADGPTSMRTGWLAAAAIAWLAITGLAAAAGVFARFELRPPPMAFLVLGCIGAGFALGFSPIGRVLSALPLPVLIAAQCFRLPLELVMHQAARQGVMPHELSFSGYNFDIVTGALAIPVAALVSKGMAPRWLAKAWNVWGFAMLAVIAAVVVAATPMLHLFGNDPLHLNTWVAYFPFVWLPAGPVVFALAGHIVIARKLAQTAHAAVPARRVMARELAPRLSPSGSRAPQT